MTLAKFAIAFSERGGETLEREFCSSGLASHRTLGNLVRMGFRLPKGGTRDVTFTMRLETRFFLGLVSLEIVRGSSWCTDLHKKR